MKIKNIRLFEIEAWLKTFSDIKNVGFAILVAKNLRKVSEHCDDLRKGNFQTDEFEDYNKKRIEICKKYAVKNDSGEPKIENNQYIINNELIIDGKSFEEAQKILMEDNKKCIEEQENISKQFISEMDEEVDFEFFSIPSAKLPDEFTSGQIQLINELIDLE